MSVLAGKEFSEWLIGKRVIDPREATDRMEVRGSLDLIKDIPLSQRRLENLVFFDDIDFSNCTFEGKLEISGCHFKGHLVLNEVAIKGSLLIQHSTFKPLASSIFLDHAKIEGSLIIEALSGEENEPGPTVSLENATIAGGVTITGKLGTPNQLFYVGAQHAKVGADFVIAGGDITLMHGLSLAGIQLGGSLQLGLGGERLRIGTGVDLENGRVQGNLNIYDIMVEGVLDMTGIRVSGNIDLRRSWGPGRLFLIRKGIRASNIHVDGRVEFSGGTIGLPRNNSSSETIVDFTNSSIGGALTLAASPKSAWGGLTLEGSLSCRGLSCAGQVSLIGITINGSAKFDGAHLPGGLWVVPSGGNTPVITGDLFLSTLRGQPWIVLTGIAISGDLRLLASEISDLQIGPGSVGEYGEYEIIPPKVGRLAMRSTHVHGNCSLLFLQVDGTLSDFSIQGLYIESSTIEGNMNFWSSSKFDDLRRIQPDLPVLNPFDYSAVVVGPVWLVNSTINGTLDLSFLKALGPLRLADTHIKGDLLFCSPQTVPDINVSLRERVLHEKAFDPLCRASAFGADLRLLRVDNDLDLTGLSVFQESPAESSHGWAFGRPGSIDARQLKVGGEIKAYAKIDGKESFVEVPGQLDLRNLEADHLEISSHSFSPERLVSKPRSNLWWRWWHTLCWIFDNNFVPASISSESQPSLVLSEGKIGSAFIPTIKTSGRMFSVSLDGLRVDSWDIGDSKDGGGRESFRQLLEMDPTFRRSTYRSIESYLRNRGEEDSADFIYREMWEREQRQAGTIESLFSAGQAVSGLSLPWFRRLWIFLARKAALPWRWLYGALLRYGTSPMRLLFVIVVLGLVAFPLYRHPGNVEPSLERLGVDPGRDSSSKSTDPAGTLLLANYDISPAAAEWPATNAFALLIRYHIPIVPTALRADWAMRNDSEAIYDPALIWPGVKPCQPKESSSFSNPPSSINGSVRVCETSGAIKFPFAAEDIASAFMILNYAMWPLLLGFLIRRLLRH